jgi:hypothetical protein
VVVSDVRVVDIVTGVALGLEHRAFRVRVRYRRADGEFVDTTLDRVPVDELTGSPLLLRCPRCGKW